MANRERVDRVTEENWQAATKVRRHAGIWSCAYVDRDEDGFFGVWGSPGQFGFTVRCASLEEALAWVTCEPQPFITIEVVLPDAVGE